MCLESKVKTISESDKRTFLDTLELNTDYFKSESHAYLYNTAIRKHNTNVKLIALINVAEQKENLSFVKSLWDTWHCKNVLIQNGTQLQGKLCRKRWCHNCNRVRVAENIDKYGDALLKLKQPFLVTLTLPTVSERELHSSINKRNKAFTKIVNNLSKNYGIKFSGLKSLEITFSNGKYHPHFHVVCDTKEVAMLLERLWLKMHSRANKYAQDIRPITTVQGLLEVFKYTVKPIANYLAHASYVMYTTLFRRKTITTYGEVRKAKKTVQEQLTENTKADYIEPKFELWIWEQDEVDYISADYSKLIHTQAIKLNYESNQQTSVHTHTESKRKANNIEYQNHRQDKAINSSESTKQRNDCN
jgi:hypothetical protein